MGVYFKKEMREIKFRAWDKIRKVMFEVTTMDMDDSGQFPQRIEDGEPLRFIDRKNVELIQFTGLKDKNGKEIYEGDIVKFLSILGNICIREVFLKTQGDISYCFKIVNEGNFGLNSYDADNYEIIGNIYENPGLEKE